MPPSPISARDKELLAMPAITDHFPVVFPNNASWHEFDACCTGCGKTLSRANVRGLVSMPVPTVAVIEAVGACADCKLLSRYNYRLHDDMRITGQMEDGWRTWRPKRDLWGAIAHAIRGLLWFRQKS